MLANPVNFLAASKAPLLDFVAVLKSHKLMQAIVLPVDVHS